MKKFLIVCVVFIGLLSGCGEDTVNASPPGPQTYYFDVAFNPLNGAASSTYSVQSNTSVVMLPANPTRDGFNFGGWYYSTDYSVAYSQSSLILSNVTLYAKWIEVITTHHILFQPLNGESDTSFDLLEGSNLTVPSDPVKAGYVFYGWKNSSDVYATTNIVVSNDMLFQAQWRTAYTITLSNGGMGATGATVLVPTFQGDVVVLSNPSFSKDGWAFAGWGTSFTSTNVVYTNNQSIIIAGNTTLYAKYVHPAAFALREIGPKGGYVFYDKGSYSDGWRYLEACPMMLASTAIWGLAGTQVGANQNIMGGGKVNTDLIVSVLADANSAGWKARHCAYNLASDWYLPCNLEMDQLYLNLIKGSGYTPVGNYTTTERIWSSTEYPTGENAKLYACSYNFSIVTSSLTVSKEEVGYVIPIRRF